MQAGYRVDAKKAARALKAAVKNNKLDKITYGSDQKTNIMLPPIGVQSVDASTTANLDTATTSSQTTSSQERATPGVFSIPTALDASVRPEDSISNVGSSPRVYSRQQMEPIRQAIPSQASTTNAMLAQELLGRIRQGVKPSDIKSEVGKTSVIAVAKSNASAPLILEFVPPSSSQASAPLSTTSAPPSAASAVQQPISNVSPVIDTTTTSALPSAASPTVASPVSITSNPSIGMTNPQGGITESVGATTQSDAAAVNPKPPTVEPILGKKEKPINDTELQQKAITLFGLLQDKLDEYKKMFVEDQKLPRDQQRLRLPPDNIPTSYNISLFKLDKTAEPDLRVVVQAPGPKGKNYSFSRYLNGTKGKTFKDQMTHSIDYSLNQAIDKIKEATPDMVFNKITGEMTAAGLNPDASVSIKPIKWASRLVRGNTRFVMYPTFLNGTIRYYNDANKVLITQKDASKAFLNIVKDIIDTNTFDPKDYASLQPNETHKANLFIKYARPIIPSGVIFNMTTTADIADLKARYKVLVGELSAGNKGSMLINEMKGILDHLKTYKAIGAAKANSLIKALDEF